MTRKKYSSEFKSKVALEARLYQEIGRLKAELDWLKKKYKQIHDG
jgi:hypothetical protein